MPDASPNHEARDDANPLAWFKSKDARLIWLLPPDCLESKTLSNPFSHRRADQLAAAAA
jgi:hypothetical protein